MSEPASVTKDRQSLFDQFCVILKSEAGAPESTARELLAHVPSGAFDAPDSRETGIVFLLGKFETNDDADNAADVCSIVETFIADVSLAHKYLPEGHPITIHLSSGGGDVEHGLAMIAAINAARRGGRQVRCHVAGFAFSMAHDILQACDHRSIEPGGFLMIHEVNYTFSGSSSEQNVEAGFSRKLENSAYEAWSLRTGRPADYYRKKIKQTKTWYISATEALAEGLVDEIAALPSFAAPTVPATPKPRRRRKAADEPLAPE